MMLDNDKSIKVLIDYPMKLILPKFNCLGKKNQFNLLDNLRSFGLIMNLPLGKLIE